MSSLLCTLLIPFRARSSSGHTLCISGFMDDFMIAYNGPYGDYGMFIPLQRATSLRRRTQAHNPIATYWLHRMLETTAGAETRRVHRATNARVGGAEPSMHHSLF